MPRVVMLARDLLARLQLDAERGQPRLTNRTAILLAPGRRLELRELDFKLTAHQRVGF